MSGLHFSPTWYGGEYRLSGVVSSLRQGKQWAIQQVLLHAYSFHLSRACAGRNEARTVAAVIVNWIKNWKDLFKRVLKKQQQQTKGVNV